MNNKLTYPGIQNIEFINSTILFVHLTNERVFIVSLDKFPVIKNLSSEQKREFEIMMISISHSWQLMKYIA